jgi:hypothetical protein
MKKAILGLVVVAAACKSTSDGANQDGKSSQLTAAAPQCEETCGGTFAASSLVGCVTTCDNWKTERMTVIKGKSLYPLRKPAQGCSFNHTRRDANKVRSGTVSETFTFGFQYSEGIGDGGFLITGSGTVEPGKILDYTLPEDKKTLGSKDQPVAVTFIRQDPNHDGKPSVLMTTKAQYSGENKELLLVLSDNFDAARPFAKIVEARFLATKDSETKHEIACGK